MEKLEFGFLYEPSTESEVVLLFGALLPYIGRFLEKLGLGSSVLIDEWTENPTDCIMKIDGKEVRVEFELYSSNFIGRHDPKKCDLIVCWINNWENPPQNIKILELKEVHKKLVAQKGLRLIFEDRPKYLPRKFPYTKEEFMDALKNNVGKQDFKVFYDFIEEILKLESIQLQTGIGEKIPTLKIGFKKFGVFPLCIEANGKASIAYYNVNVKPPTPLLPRDLMEKIWKLLGTPKTRKGEIKKWHYIKASNSAELVKKLREVINVVLEAKK
ncbi:hypothetical protein J7K27_03615 [Candidatus Bathyarchaeota archaeon]|nr:hypothetical protein [Candidatus Bathyarchaeota archaeon]